MTWVSSERMTDYRIARALGWEWYSFRRHELRSPVSGSATDGWEPLGELQVRYIGEPEPVLCSPEEAWLRKDGERPRLGWSEKPIAEPLLTGELIGRAKFPSFIVIEDGTLRHRGRWPCSP